jgi:chorismate mutase
MLASTVSSPSSSSSRTVDSTTLRSVRGATSVTVDTPEAIHASVSQLLHALVEANHIQPDDVCAVFFTLTDDLHSLAPAKVARDCLPWQDTALFMAQEPFIEGLPRQLVRVLIQFETPLARHELTHVYHGEAVQLRPERGQSLSESRHNS